MKNPVKHLDLSISGAGTVVRVNHGLYDHVGLLGEPIGGKERTVLAFSAQSGGFVEQPFSEFAGNRIVVLGGYLGRLPSGVVLARARSLQHRPYSWLSFNCEHFVHYAHGVAIESPQLQAFAIVASLFCVLAMGRRS